MNNKDHLKKICKNIVIYCTTIYHAKVEKSKVLYECLDLKAFNSFVPFIPS
jgi:hypothetical protein